jgi:hypothetical protein
MDKAKITSTDFLLSPDFCRSVHRFFFILVFQGSGFGGHAIFFVSPAAEVYQLAAFGAEGAVGVILPFGGFATVRTVHKLKM